MKKVLILVGATGVGKTEVSIKIAQKFNMEIISADSVQVFKGFDIGSAKITEEEKCGINHYGIDIKSPNEEFSVSEFVDYTKMKIDEIISRNKIPMIVGGTGLYIKALVDGYDFGNTQCHKEFRKEMMKLADKNGLNYLYERLLEKSPSLAENIDKNNLVRLIRALEIAEFGSEKGKEKSTDYEFKIIALTYPRDKLYERINLRSRIMVENGLIEEVKRLYEQYGDCQPMRAIGYKEVIPFIKGEISEDEMLNLISQHTRNYAKRQITFMKSIENIEYFDKSEEDCYKKIEEDIKQWLAI